MASDPFSTWYVFLHGHALPTNTGEASIPVLKQQAEQRSTERPSIEDELNHALRKLISDNAADPKTTAAAMMVSAVRLTVLLDMQTQNSSDEQIRHSLHQALDAMLADTFSQREAMKSGRLPARTVN
jgi:hypothetical protein